MGGCQHKRACVGHKRHGAFLGVGAAGRCCRRRDWQGVLAMLRGAQRSLLAARSTRCGAGCRAALPLHLLVGVF